MGLLPDRLMPKFIRPHSNYQMPPIIDKVETKRYAFPLALNLSDSYAADRMALIGDAAHRIHPLAG